jgi:uncharacterized protein (DUF2236 family)
MDVMESIDMRSRIADATAGLFAHADYPLAHSLEYPGDPGLFGPGSATWEVMGDVASFIGGIRALLIQAVHPEVVAGVADHSSYEHDPLGRLSRTSSYVTATAYGAMPEVEAALAVVRRAHVPVHGESHRGMRYSASGPEFAAWVHNVLIDSFLVAHQVFGPAPLSTARADAFVAEQAELGAMLHCRDLPTTGEGLATWVSTHPAIAWSPGMEQTVRFLRRPPLPAGVSIGYRVLFHAAAATIPEDVASLLGVTRYRGAVPSGRSMVAMLRWAMGSSPSWWLALERMGAPKPPDVRFRRPPNASGAEQRWTASANR